jgi:hypothetical protein
MTFTQFVFYLKIKTMKFERPSVEAAAATITIARYPIAEYIAKRVEDDKPIFIPMVAAVVSDIYDGAILRRLSRETPLDTPLRRIIDGTIDHATAGRVSWEVAKKNPSARPYIAIIAARAAFAAAGLNGLHLASTGEVTKGRKYQKATHLSTALFGLVAASTKNRLLTHATGALAAGIAVATAPAHFKKLGETNDGVYREL